MNTILRKTVLQEVEITLGGTDIAELFWSLDEHGQAEFFNHLGLKFRLTDQLYAVSRCDKLSNSGRSAMHLIGENP